MAAAAFVGVLMLMLMALGAREARAFDFDHRYSWALAPEYQDQPIGWWPAIQVQLVNDPIDSDGKQLAGKARVPLQPGPVCVIWVAVHDSTGRQRTPDEMQRTIDHETWHCLGYVHP